MILKNKITRQESRSPSSKTAGPSVPAENLSNALSVKLPAQVRVHGREYVEVHRKPDKKYLGIL